MTYYSKNVIDRAKEMDLLTYLRNYEPYELVRVSHNVYSTKTHDSLKISNGMWMWWSRGIGGKSAVDYLVKVRGMSFLEAISLIAKDESVLSKPYRKLKYKTKRNLILPPRADNNDIAVKYLKQRGINEDILSYFVEREMIYQSSPMNNIVFVGFDEKGVPKYAGMRGTDEYRYISDAFGSDKSFPFRLVNKNNTNIHIFEGAIDLLSFATLLYEQGSDFKSQNLVSLSGVYQPSKKMNNVRLPKIKMAIVYIIPIRTHLDRTLAYVGNKNKTENENYEKMFLNLHSVLDYSINDLKTEEQFYVTPTQNLTSVENAFQEMMRTKKRHRKTDGILGYHIIQSFTPNEGTPDKIHDLGIEFLNRAFNGYEGVVATHLNTDCLHNHLVVNSVQAKSGLKFNDCLESYYHLREISDDLCREYGLSVINNPKKRGHKSYDLYMAEKNGEWTKDAIIRRDIDECILTTTNRKAFFIEMQRLGYTFNFNRKYPTISHPNFERPRRLKTLGENYTIESIDNRIKSKWQRYRIDIPQQDNLVEDFFVPLVDPTYQQIYVSFVTVVQYVKKKPNKNRGLDKYLIDEMRKLDKLIEQQNLLCDNNIDASEQLSEYRQSCEKELQECYEGRKRLRNMLKVAVRSNDEKEIAEIKNSISVLSQRMNTLRKDIRICDRIQNDEPKIENKINEIMNDKERKEMSTDERFRRRSRTNREDDTAGR